MSMIYNTLQNVQSCAGTPLFRSVVPPALSTPKGEATGNRPLFVWSMVGILSGVLLGLLLIG